MKNVKLIEPISNNEEGDSKTQQLKKGLADPGVQCKYQTYQSGRERNTSKFLFSRGESNAFCMGNLKAFFSLPYHSLQI